MNLDYLLAPLDKDLFFREYWEIKPARIVRASPDYLDRLLTVPELDAAICGNSIRVDDCRFARQSSVVLGSVAAYSSNRALNGIVDPIKARQLFNRGWTIIFERTQRWHSPFNTLCAELFGLLNHPAQCNVYLKPPSSYGFGPHFDTHGVLVLQVYGKKEWKIYSNFVDLPLPDQGRPLPSQPDDDASVEFILEQGDALYIPRGLIHDADSLDDASAHITLGFLSHSWHDLLSLIFRRISKENVELR